MKELSIEEKAKRYDEAIKIAKEINNEQQAQPFNIMAKVFPELKESEDERIRKEIIQFLELPHPQFVGKRKQEVWIAWLEKQGEDTYDYKRVVLDKFDERIREFSDMLEDKPKPYWDGWYEAMEWIRTHGNPFEKQGEQKPADKVEPKFKVGDWIVQENIGVYKIIEICESWYEVIDFEDNHYSISFDKEHMCHLWTIQDAKDGDVLYSPCLKLLWIFKSRDTLYCGCNLNYNDGAFCEEGYFERPTDAIPATKEQRDFLFKKMKEAGYEWDTEKKELKRINLNKAEHGKYYYCIKDYFSGGKKFASKGDVVQALRGLPIMGLEDISEYFLPFINVQNPAWSEEDELRIKSIKNTIEQFVYDNDMLDVNGDCCDGSIIKNMNWLKSLKERYTWKPSYEQMEALEDSIEFLGCTKKVREYLKSLYQDLKRLREE